jgi:hypothetical protein
MRETIVSSIAWIIFANKPVYPLYVWFYIGSGAQASAWTMLAAPLYAAIALFAHRFALAARIALPIVGAADTMFATKLFGPASGTELFLAPCAMIAALSFDPSERKTSRMILIGIFGAFVVLHGRYGAPWHDWSSEELDRFLTLNAFAVASLTVYVGWRFAGVDEN